MIHVNQLIPAICLGLFIAVAYALIRKAKKDNPKYNLGDVLNQLIIKEHTTFFVVMLFLVALGEAMFAASIHVVGEVEVNFATRILNHGVMQISSVVFILRAISLMRVYFTSKKEDRNHRSWIEIIPMLIISFYVPWLNYYIVAGGLGESELAPYCLYPAAFKVMSYAMKVCTGALFFHYILMIADAANVLGQPKTDIRYNQGFDPNEAVNNNNKKGAEKSKGVSEQNVMYLLRRYNIGNKLNHFTKLAMEALNDMTSTDQQVMAKELSALVDQSKKLDQEKADNNWSEEKRAEKNEELRKKIHKLFENSPSNGKGFGITLPPKKNKKKGK